MDAKIAIDYVEKLMNEKTKGLEEKIDSLRGEMQYEFADVKKMMSEHQKEIETNKDFRTRFLAYVGAFIGIGAIIMTFIATLFQQLVAKYIK